MPKISFHPDYLFEISWEICNKVGGIYTVLSTKSEKLYKTFGDSHIYIGPDVWMETSKTPGFKEDNSLYSSWASEARSSGLSFRIGRWLVPGNPVVILVNFKQYFSERNNIFAEYWEKYKLDSISGQWDYIEPAMFGYAAGKIIESFYTYHISGTDTIQAQFHEWMSGMGILYLKDKVPQVGTIFTTHATMIGRCIASNGMELYKNLSYYDATDIANRLNIRAKYSLEKLSVQLCDVFTTVSDITSKEAQSFYGRAADLIQPNGFIREFAHNMDDCNSMRKKGRKCIFKVAETMFSRKFDNATPVIITSGRYEYHNKGIDILIDALAELNNNIDRDVIVMVCVPANVINPVDDLSHSQYLTHNIHNAENDAIISNLKRKGLTNDDNCKVKVIDVPTYLNGNDGIFNVNYYYLLAGSDLTVFPSYYEPYGYTPLESIAFAVPSVTSSLAGFGQYVRQYSHGIDDGVAVLERDDDNYHAATLALTGILQSFVGYDDEKLLHVRNNAFGLSEKFLWDTLISNYFDAYQKALDNTKMREDLYKDKKRDYRQITKSIAVSASPTWRKVYVRQSLPDILKPLRALSMNLWWSWNKDAENLFASINPDSWEINEHNPISLLESLSQNDIIALENDGDFKQRLKDVYDRFQAYMNDAVNKSKPSVAYFSMEYGIHNTLKIFSGGLGMLAGDYLKEMSDSNVDAVGIGLLYRYGYFKQSMSPSGDQIATDIPQKFTHLPIIPVRDENDDWVKVQIAFPARNLTAKVWRVDVGRIPLYLLDTDMESNWDIDRSVTYHLYGGNWENRIKQEILLGIGGIRLLRKIGLNPTVYHLNEGHAAFAGLERLREYVDERKFLFDEALEIVRSSTLFTTHTPVPAGHDAFTEDLVRTYLSQYSSLLNCSWERLMNLGKFTPNSNEKFSMSVLAIHTAQEVNGVSKIHGDVTKDMFIDLYKGYYTNELYMDYVTNGVHYPSWVAEKWYNLHKKYFGEEFLNDQMNPKYWEKIYQVPDKEIWDIRQELRKSLIDTLKKRLEKEMTGRQEDPKIIMKTVETLSENKLTVCFARRFATYKRAHLLFKNLDRLKAIVNSETHPVQFIFAGKAHPADQAGKDLIRMIIEVSRRPEFVGKIVFVENYDMEIAKKLVQGADIWLNTPTRPLEASGTSGEKAVMNGVVNLSVLDGWWAEGYRKGAGWALPQHRTYSNQSYQDVLDSEIIYHLFENDITQLFYENRNPEGVPVDWVEYIKNSFALISPHYTMKRQLTDYQNKFYYKLAERFENIKADNYRMAIKYAAWKKKMRSAWNEIVANSIVIPDPDIKTFKVGDVLEMSIELKINELSVDDIAVDLVVGRKEVDFKGKYISIVPMIPGEKANGRVKFEVHEPISSPGIVDVAIRVRPNNLMMPYKMDIELIKWI